VWRHPFRFHVRHVGNRQLGDGCIGCGDIWDIDVRHCDVWNSQCGDVHLGHGKLRYRDVRHGHFS
jgi:hypothetical protein